jgi:hypothetical protein
MRKRVLILTVSAALTCAVLPALAQDAHSHLSQSSEVTGQGDGTPERGGMMGRGMMDREGMRGGAMARGGLMGAGTRGQNALFHSMMMRPG